MKVAAISDTHGRVGWEIPECDTLIHCGDTTASGTLEETVRFLDFLSRTMRIQGFPRNVLIVPGNHDACMQTICGRVREALPDNVHLLVDQGIAIEGKTFWGSPWTPPFMLWSFMAEENILHNLYRNQMPVVIDVLITHGPPKGILDPGWNAPHVGSEALLEAVSKRDIRRHVFGHLHGAGGQSQPHGRTMMHNVAACDEAYKLRHPAQVFEI